MRDLLDEAIGASPASTVDIDRVVATGRRRIRLRRLAMASPVVPAAAAVALAVTVLGGSPTAPTNPTPIQPGAAASGAAPVYDETQEETQQRLADALTDHLAAALPGATLTAWPSGEAGVVITANDDLTRYEGSVVLTTNDGANQLIVAAEPGGAPPSPTPPPSGIAWLTWVESCSQLTPPVSEQTPEGYPVTTECEESVGADGQTIVVLSKICDCPGQAVTLHREAYVTWTNARVVVGINNALKSGTPGATSLAALLLTKEQLVAIASDPELTVAG